MDVLCVSGHFGLVVGKFENQMGEWNDEDFEAGKYIGYENINTFCPSFSPLLVELQSIRLHADTSELVNHCKDTV